MSQDFVEQFYKRSHKISLKSNLQSMLDRHKAEEELISRPHRYSCVFSYLNKNQGLNVVELGFGLPRLLIVLSAGCSSYTIVDIVDRAEGVALPDNIRFQKSDLNADFPFSDNYFDCSIAMMIIEHLFDPFHSFREISRITSPGGKVFINLPNIASIRCRLQLLAGRLPVTSSADWFEKGEWDGNHLHYFTVEDVLRLATLNGLHLDALHPIGKMIWLKRLRPSLFCHEISFEFTKLKRTSE